MQKREFYGYLYILIGATLWGVSSVVAKVLFNIGLPPAELVHIRLTLTTGILLLLLLFYDRKHILISWKDLPYFFILGFVGITGMRFTYYYVISKIQVAPAILLQYLQPVWVAVYAFLFQKEPFPKGKAASLVLAVLGCYFLVGECQGDLLRLDKIGPEPALEIRKEE